jgi:hypothetical protein
VNGPDASVKNAATLIYKALQTNLTTAGDTEYRELAALFLVDAGFRRMCEDIATGFTLQIIDASELRGLVLVPESRESRFAVRLGDIRAHGMEQPHRAALVLAHISICAAFFPTSDSLDDDSLIPPPVTIAVCRDTLYSLAQRLKDTNPLPIDIPLDLAPGWEAVCALPQTLRESVRAAPSSGAGIVKIALNQMVDGGLVRLDRGTEDDPQASYTATHRLRVQLREIALRRLFEIAQLCTARR